MSANPKAGCRRTELTIGKRGSATLQPSRPSCVTSDCARPLGNGYWRSRTALETWHTERRVSVEAGMAITPSGVVEYIIRTKVPAKDREAVRDALPV